jgi:hypothetical protein
MSLYAQAQELSAEPRSGGNAQPVVTTTVDPSTFEALAEAIEAAYPNMALNVDAIEKGGVRPDDSKIVPFACKQSFPKKGSITFYDTGKVVWAGVEAVELPVPEPEAES